MITFTISFWLPSCNRGQASLILSFVECYADVGWDKASGCQVRAGERAMQTVREVGECFFKTRLAQVLPAFLRQDSWLHIPEKKSRESKIALGGCF